MPKYAIALHGGAGTIDRKDITGEMEKAYKLGLEEALDAGYLILDKGGSAVDAVTQSCVILEDSPLFNAGRGSVFTRTGTHEMDACIMDGSTLRAGALTCVRNIKNPILLALEIMNHSEHVFLSGEGAFNFAVSRGITTESDEYFFTRHRYDQWESVRDQEDTYLDHNDPGKAKLEKPKKFGTVGVVAHDAEGNLAAATSTGGMTNKNYNRIGDSPVIGSGTYANNKTCAISCTGHGEVFLLAVAAYDVSCLMEYRNCTLQQAMDIVVNDKLVKMKGEGGIIGVDAKGNISMQFNSTGMYRAARNNEGYKELAIYR
ncbi:MAG TPA: isoaspartyl peptidase/L-asparaginase [Flavisolibacter sp.]|nr:isoaspartyl peptidase/L-asparaginase [Flavisolibacter sp.]